MEILCLTYCACAVQFVLNLKNSVLGKAAGVSSSSHAPKTPDFGINSLLAY